MPDSLRLATTLPVPPSAVFAAWLDEALHSKMTGAKATSEPRVGGRFTAWDGYIEGTHTELDPNARIVQAWRTSEFPADAADSRVELFLSACDGGTEIVLVHSDIPDGQGSRYESGWVEFYFDPMRKYFGAKRAAPEKRRTKKAAKSAKKVAKKATAKKKAAAKGPKRAAAKKAKKGATKAKKKGARKRGR